MTIKVGDKVPDVAVATKTADGIAQLSRDEMFGGKKVVLFALPGAFTPTCSAKHLPSFVTKAGDLKAKGVDTIACLSVNDAFVMDAWGSSQGAGDDVTMIADGSAAFTKALGLELDLTDRGMGVRSQRYAMVVDDGTVSQLFVEAAGAYEVSSAEHVLSNL